MNELEDFMADWKKITAHSIADGKAFISLKNNTIMDSIIQFEQKEKDTKSIQKNITIALFILVVVAGIFQVAIGATRITPIHLAGYVLMFSGLVLTIFLNRTDNFPDVRTLATKAYLHGVRNDIFNRLKKHKKNTILLLVFYIPGMYLAFHNYFIRGDFTTELNIGMKIFITFASLGIIVGALRRMKQYKAEISELDDELNELIKELA